MTRKDPIHPDARKLALHMAKVRNERGLSIKELADRTGLSEPSVKRLFTGEVHANFLKLIRVARAMEASPNELLGFSVSGPDRQERERGALEAVFAALGLSEEVNQHLVQAVLTAIEANPLPGLTPEQSVRSRVSVDLERSTLSKRPQ